MTAGMLDFSILAPIGFVTIAAFLVLIGDIWLSRSGPQVTPWLVLICSAALALAMFTAASTYGSGTSSAFNPAHAMLRVDPFSSFMTVAIALAALLSIWLSMSYLPALHIDQGEYYALMMMSVAGAFVLVAAVDMMAVFVGLELMSIPLHTLAGFDRRKLRSNEAGLKHLLTSGVASAVLLYGIALLYGATGATSFVGIRDGFDSSDPLALAGLALVVVGVMSRLAAVPFHQWLPDVYEGAPTSVTAFMSVVVTMATCAALLRFVLLALPERPDELQAILALLAGSTMLVGNLLAVIQTSVKRMLAYSSVAHVGYLLVGVAAGTRDAWVAVVFSLLAQGLTSLGAFGLIAAMARGGRERERIEDYAGVGRSRPGVAALMTLLLLSLAGIPGTAGFMSRFLLFKSAVDADLIWLAVLGVVSSLVSVHTCLRLPAVLYMRESTDDVPGEVDTFAGIALGGCAIGVLWLGLLPNPGVFPVLDVVRGAALGLIP